MKKYILILFLTVALPLNIAFADTDNSIKNITFQQILDILESIPEINLSDSVLEKLSEKFSDNSGIKIEEKFLFDVSVERLDGIFDKTRVKYGVDFLSDSSDFAFWKIRVRCDEGMEAYIEGNSENMCDSITEDHSVGKDGGYVTFVNNNDHSARAEVKFRAFNSNRDWLASESAFVALSSRNK